MFINNESRVGTLAATYPGASRVFLRYGIDFCCSGKRTLAQACASASVDPDQLAREIVQESHLPMQDLDGDAAAWQRQGPGARGRPVRGVLRGGHSSQLGTHRTFFLR